MGKGYLPPNCIIRGDGIIHQHEAEKHNSPLLEEQVNICRKWIRYYARPSKKYNTAAFSYGLKHQVEKAYNTYVSNGAFIQAAFLEGYRVKKVDGLNAIFNMVIPEEEWQYVTPVGFSRWLFEQKERHDPVGDLARDAFYDKTWPRQAITKLEIQEYLENLGASSGAMKSFQRAWEEFGAVG